MTSSSFPPLAIDDRPSRYVDHLAYLKILFVSIAEQILRLSFSFSQTVFAYFSRVAHDEIFMIMFHLYLGSVREWGCYNFC